jgi:hypothetical protein
MIPGKRKCLLNVNTEMSEKYFIVIAVVVVNGQVKQMPEQQSTIQLP